MKLFLSAIWSFVSFLVQPEDSMTGLCRRPAGYAGGRGRCAGTIKAIVWIIIAVAAGLVVSKL